MSDSSLVAILAGWFPNSSGSEETLLLADLSRLDSQPALSVAQELAALSLAERKLAALRLAQAPLLHSGPGRKTPSKSAARRERARRTRIGELLRLAESELTVRKLAVSRAVRESGKPPALFGGISVIPVPAQIGRGLFIGKGLGSMGQVLDGFPTGDESALRCEPDKGNATGRNRVWTGRDCRGRQTE
jgi:hypothetical protein